MAGVLSGVVMSNNLIDLEGAGATIVPVVLGGLPPDADGVESDPAENHHEHEQSYEKQRMETPSGARSGSSIPARSWCGCASVRWVDLFFFHVQVVGRCFCSRKVGV